MRMQYKKYCFKCTGKRVLIFDENENLIKTIKNLQYVYTATISFDNTKVLLISNLNIFYIVSLEDFKITKHTIKGKYCDNLEGNGCWSIDGKNPCFCITDPNSMLSAFRIYQSDDMCFYKDIICDKYWLTNVLSFPKIKKYLLTGFNRKNHKNYLIWYDEHIFEEYLIEKFEDVVVNIKYDLNKNHCIIHGLDKTILCSPKGTYICDF